LLLTALLGSATAVAAPVPKESPTEEQFRKLYGTRFDEKKRGKFTSDTNRLAISLGDQPSETDFAPTTAPRVMREIQGDFVARVAITCPLPNEVPKQRPDAYIGGGFVVVFGKDHYLHFGRYYAVGLTEQPGRAWKTEFRVEIERLLPPSESLISAYIHTTPKPGFLSLTRRGKKFTTEFSSDGQKWEVLRTIEESAGEKLQLGLFALHNTKATREIVFADYSVIAPKD
jgi:hypothetical protein